MEVWGELHYLAALPPGKNTGTYLTGGWVGPRHGLDVLSPSRLETWINHQMSRNYTNWVNPAPETTKQSQRINSLSNFAGKSLKIQDRVYWCRKKWTWLNQRYRGADNSLARPGRKQANVSVRMAWISFGALSCRKRNLMTARVSILLKSRASLTCFRACFLPGRAKDLSATRVLLQHTSGQVRPQTEYLVYRPILKNEASRIQDISITF